MKPLAILKHISSKNADYGEAEKYLTFEHDLPDLSRPEEAIDTCAEDFHEKRRVLKETETRHYTLNDLRRESINYRKTRSVADEGKKLSGRKAEAYRVRMKRIISSSRPPAAG